jgi:xylose isomerase
MDHLGKFLQMAVDYKKEIGFTGPFYIEPKPKEPTKHQYDSDAAACYAFLQRYGLTEHFKLTLRPITRLAGHTFQHEMGMRQHRRLAQSCEPRRRDAGMGLNQFPAAFMTRPGDADDLGTGGFWPED